MKPNTKRIAPSFFTMGYVRALLCGNWSRAPAAIRAATLSSWLARDRLERSRRLLQRAPRIDVRQATVALKDAAVNHNQLDTRRCRRVHQEIRGVGPTDMFGASRDTMMMSARFRA